MNEQTILLILLVLALGVTLWLYILKAVKQVKYKGDERWKMIQLHAMTTADKTNAILILLLVLAPIFIGGETLFTLNRICTLGAVYIGIRNLFELTGIYYHDRRL